MGVRRSRRRVGLVGTKSGSVGGVAGRLWWWWWWVRVVVSAVGGVGWSGGHFSI